MTIDLFIVLILIFFPLSSMILFSFRSIWETFWLLPGKILGAILQLEELLINAFNSSFGYILVTDVSFTTSSQALLALNINKQRVYLSNTGYNSLAFEQHTDLTSGEPKINGSGAPERFISNATATEGLGGKVIAEYLKNISANLQSGALFGIESQNLNLPINLTSAALNATADLVNMINKLEVAIQSGQIRDSEQLKSLSLLLDFIVSSTDPKFKFNVKLTSNQFKLLTQYPIELSAIRRSNNLDGSSDLNDSGVYCFQHESGKFGIGSSISCLARLRDHISSFKGHRAATFLHTWINNNGGIGSAVWSPIITYPNLYTLWYEKYPAVYLNIGGINLLRAFALYPARILEQALIDFYKPYLNETSTVGFFNFALSPADLLKTRINDVYLVWDATTGSLLFTSSSIKDVATKLGVARSTVKNYLNWVEGLEVSLNTSGEKITCLIRKQGSEIRSNKIDTQLYTKNRYPKVELKGQTLYDLKPGLTYVIDPLTTNTVYGPFDSRLELFKKLYPNKWEKVNSFSNKQNLIRNFIANNITSVMNLAIPGGITSEIGKFWYCCNPDHPFKFNKIPKPLFTVTSDGLCSWYANNSSVKNFSRKTVAKHLASGELYGGIRFISESVMLNLFPDLPTGENTVFYLSSSQLNKLNLSLGKQ